MKKHRWMVILVTVVAVLLVAYSIAFTVDWRSIAIVKTFGKAGKPIIGAVDAGVVGGLHFKWPWPIQSLVRYDARQFLFEDTADQIQTNDGKNVYLTVFCTWRIHEPTRFLTSIATVEAAEESLRTITRAIKAEVTSQHPWSDFVNTDPQNMRQDQIEQEMRDRLSAQAMDRYGVAVVTLAIKAHGLSQEVSKKSIEGMKEDQNRKAESFRSTAEADAIKSRAQTAKDTILAFARRTAEAIRAEGARAAAQYYPQFKENEQLAMYLRELDFLRDTLKENSVFLLDASLQHAFGFFGHGPSLPPLELRQDGPASRPSAPAPGTGQ